MFPANTRYLAIFLLNYHLDDRLHETIDFLLDDLYCETLCKEIVLTCFFVHIL